MTTATHRGTSRLRLGVLILAVAVLMPRTGSALTLDDRGEMRLGLRAYTAARIGTEEIGGSDNPLSFPPSDAGHLRQHRYFLEVKLDHDLRRLATTSTGAAWLFKWLDPSVLKYSFQYRGEGEGIYDYGPEEYTQSFTEQKKYHLAVPDVPNLGLSSTPPDEYALERERRLRRIARQRHRLFLGYMDIEKGPVFLRVGRQILAWGETDIFRLMDNINPLDQGFGGFLIALDERRVPLDMVRGSYHFGTIGPVDDAFFEGFAALGNRVSTNPGIPPGSPWIPGGLGAPNPSLNTTIVVPDKDQIRGGGRFVFNYADATFTLAHYWTYLDNPTVVFRVPKGRPFFPNSINAVQKVPRVPITGLSVTFPLTSWYSVVRSEGAYFYGEPLNRQGKGNAADSLAAPGTPGYRRLVRQNNLEGGLDPFLYPGFAYHNIVNPGVRTLLGCSGPNAPATCANFPLAATNGSGLQRDSFNYAVGLDVNRYIRWLNPGQTMFISTQLFYKHIFNSPGDLVLPVPVRNIGVPATVPVLGSGPGCPKANGKGTEPCKARPRFIHIQDDAVLQTLLITTSYRGGRVVPSYGMFYDWAGALVFQPGVSLISDPFRFVFDYTRIESPLGAGQLSALRDRDNVRFQVEYVF